MKKVFIIIAAVLTVLGLAVFAGALAVSGFKFPLFGIEEYETNTYTADEEFSNIEIDSKTANITFEKSQDGKFSVICTEREKLRHSVRVENETLKITEVDEREWFEYVSLFSKQQTMTVYLPSESYEKLTVNGSTGDITVPGGFAFESADLTESTGDAVFGAAVSGALNIKTSTGDIDLKYVEIGSIALSVSTGKINVQKVNCKEELYVHVGTGKAKLTDVACKSLRSDGGTGDITLKDVIASDSFDIERGTGDVEFEGCDAAEITVKTSTGDVTGTLYTDKIFIAKSSTGKVSVPDTTTGGRCEVTTSTGRIELRIQN